MLETIVVALMLFAGVDRNTAITHATAAEQASDQTQGEVPVDLLFGMAWVESRYNPAALSRMECSGTGKDKACRRVTGLWASLDPPPGLAPSMYCGVLQVGGYIPWARCLELRFSIELSYEVAANHLLTWSRDPACRGKQGDDRLDCALQGYGGGYKAIRNGAMSYVRRVRLQQERFRSTLRKAQVG